MDDSKLLNERNLTATQPHTFYRQLRVKDLSNIHKWWLEWDSNLRPYVRKSPNPIAEPSRPPHICLISDHNDTFRKIMPKYITKNYISRHSQLVTQRDTCLQSKRVGITNTETTDLQSDTINTSNTETNTEPLHPTFV